MQAQAYYEELVRLARIKFAQMSPENVNVILRNRGRINIEDLPTLAEAMQMSHSKLIHRLRYCPFSEFYGLTKAQFNKDSLTRNQALELVCYYIN